MEGSKRRRPRPGSGSVRDPGRHPHQGQCGGQQAIHEPGVHHPDVARTSPRTYARFLCHRACDAGATGIRLREGVGLLPRWVVIGQPWAVLPDDPDDTTRSPSLSL
jgi:hypothetical protein